MNQTEAERRIAEFIGKYTPEIAASTTLYESEYPFASGPDYYALYCEDPDRIKVEVVAPSEA